MNEYQTQPAVYPGWVMMEMACAVCGHSWIGVAAVGTQGAECPKCGLVERGFVWLGPKPFMAHDGCWITGYTRLPWWPAESTCDSACQKPQASEAGESEIDPFTGEPKSFVKRWLQRLLTAWWALKGEW